MNEFMKNFSLEGKIAFVTGASYGIGFAIASAYAAAGATIVFNDINQELVNKGLAAYEEKDIKAHGYVCDVTDEEAVQKTVAKIREEVGIIDILVNNAGIIKRIPMLEMSAADFRKVIDVDLNAPFIVSKACIPGMIEKGHGKIINICSMMSELGRETVSAYAAAKGGLKMLTRNICSEYGEANIQCNGIGPGYIETPQTAPLRERQPDGSRHPFDQFIISKTPAARWGKTEDLQGPAVFLASDASNFVNGHILYVDGGILAYIGKQPQADWKAHKDIKKPNFFNHEGFGFFMPISFQSQNTFPDTVRFSADMPPFLTICLETRILHACFEQAAVFPLRGGQLGVFVRGNRRKPVKFTAHIQRHAFLIRQSQING